MLGIGRLDNVSRIGTIPDREDDQTARLIRDGHDVFLIAGGIYHVDPGERQLNLLLEPGTKIGKAKIGKIRDAAVDDNGITATDGKAIYRLKSDGTWSRKRLGLIDNKTPWNSTACGVFDGSFYLLNGSGGQILKFTDDRISSLPDDWAGADARADLVKAKDMVIDGRIYVLLENGQIQAYYRGDAEDPIAPDVQPAITAPNVLYGGVDTAYLWVVDHRGDQGRITRVDRAGDNVYQYLLPDVADPVIAETFASIDDLVVDETRGVVYFLAGNQIWSATLPAPDTVA
jgi:hypothetical protein